VDVSNETVSVVLAVRNEERYIESTLMSLARAVLASPLPIVEVIVADGGSTDRTREIVERVAKEHFSGTPFVIYDNPRGSVSCGLNIAVAAAKGTLVSRVDGHTNVHEDYFACIRRAFEESDASVVGGGQSSVSLGTPLSDAICLANSCPLAVGDSVFHYGTAPQAAECVWMGTFRSAVLADMGGFDESLLRNQDDDLSFRIRKAGHIIWFDPRIKCDYHPRKTLSALWRQYFQYGQYRFETLLKHRRLSSVRQIAPAALALSFTLIPVGYTLVGVWALVPVVTYLAFLSKIGLWFFRRARSTTMRGPVAVAVMQVSYGFGFWAQVVKRTLRIG
jgi:succinoglycan biosynthesis protein ExoA